MTTFAVNYGWTPESIARDKALKKKNGNSAHITPVSSYQIPESYKHGSKAMPAQDTIYFKDNNERMTDKKMPVFTKVLIGTVLGGLAILAFKNNQQIKNFFNKFVKASKKTPVNHHAPVTVTGKDKEMLNSGLEKLKNLDNYKAKSKYATEIANDSASCISVKYNQDAPFVKGRISHNLENEGSKWATITLKDGKEVAVKYNPNNPNFSIKYPEYSTWESGGLDIGLFGANSCEDALRSIAEGLKKHGYDSDAIINELKNLMTI